jgi:hypothetical protein
MEVLQGGPAAAAAKLNPAPKFSWRPLRQQRPELSHHQVLHQGLQQKRPSWEAKLYTRALQRAQISRTAACPGGHAASTALQRAQEQRGSASRSPTGRDSCTEMAQRRATPWAEAAQRIDQRGSMPRPGRHHGHAYTARTVLPCHACSRACLNACGAARSSPQP